MSLRKGSRVRQRGANVKRKVLTRDHTFNFISVCCVFLIKNLTVLEFACFFFFLFVNTASHLVEELIQVFSSVRDKVLDNPHTFTVPVQRFISHFTNIKSDADLASALSVFGTGNCRRTSLRKAAAGGHRTLLSGRLLKRIRREHNYPRWTRKRNVSQSLEFCMDQSTSQKKDENKP